MRIELLTIGDELTDGRTVDTNATFIAQALSDLGLAVQRVTTVRDDRPVIAAEMRAIAARADVCITSGGLGPTSDDLTVESLAEAAGVAMYEDEAVWAHIRAVFAPKEPPAQNRRQARVPAGGRALATEVGTAPGIEGAVGGCAFFLLPGVPHELRWHLDRHVLPALRARRSGAPLLVRTLVFAGIGESALGQRVEPLGLPSSIRVAYRTRPLVNEVRLVGTDAAELDAAAARVAAVAPADFLGHGVPGLVEAVLDRCRARGLTLGAAESCTGGLFGGTVTEIPGASDVFAGAVVSYANAVKTGVLGVPEAVLAEHGAVSEPCALAMARGARRVLGCDVAVAITGVAGPGGGTAAKPVGTVCFAYAGPGFERAETLQVRGDRERVRLRSVARALDGVRRSLNP
jgi:nicotinamide-nucleotide amidase